MRQDEGEQAEAEFRRAQALAPDPVDALLGIARALDAQRKPGAAEKAFLEARRLDPG